MFRSNALPRCSGQRYETMVFLVTPYITVGWRQHYSWHPASIFIPEGLGQVWHCNYSGLICVRGLWKIWSRRKGKKGQPWPSQEKLWKVKISETETACSIATSVSTQKNTRFLHTKTIRTIPEVIPLSLVRCRYEDKSALRITEPHWLARLPGSLPYNYSRRLQHQPELVTRYVETEQLRNTTRLNAEPQSTGTLYPSQIRRMGENALVTRGRMRPNKTPLNPAVVPWKKLR